MKDWIKKLPKENSIYINSFCYTLGWFWCVLFGIHSHCFLAILGAVFLISLQLYLAKVTAINLYIQDMLLVLFSIPSGFLLELFFIQINLVHYTTSKTVLPPIWIVLLYPLFSLLINHSLKFMRNNKFLCFIFGFFGAPLSYIAGRSLGGLTFPFPLLLTWIMIGLCWGLFLILLAKLADIIEIAATETINDLNSNTSLKLLYDGDCPICHREICILQKKDLQNTINFVDISSKEFSTTVDNMIDYNTAMSQIHAIEGKNNLLIGIPAFATVYARCRLLIISTLLRIPFILKLLHPIYTLFAKNRLWITGRSDTKIKK